MLGMSPGTVATGMQVAIKASGLNLLANWIRPFIFPPNGLPKLSFGFVRLNPMSLRARLFATCARVLRACRNCLGTLAALERAPADSN